MRCVLGLIAAIGAATLPAGELRGGEPTTAVVPFAVPVAVPVAVVAQPTVFYGVSRYAPQAVPSAASVAAPLTADEVELREQTAAIFSRRCASCHGATTAAAGLALFDADERLLAALPRQAIVAACAPADGAKPAMPPAGREPLTPAEQAAVRRWAVPPRSLKY